MPSPIYQYVINLVVSSHQERSRYNCECLGVWTLCSYQLDFLMWQSLLFQQDYHYYLYVDCHSQLYVWKYSHTFALKSPNRIFVWYLENDQKPALKPHTNCLLNHLFSPYLVDAHSEHDIHERPIRTIYDTLSLTKSTLLTADTVQWCIKILLPIADFCFLFHRKNYNLLHLLCPLFPT